MKKCIFETDNATIKAIFQGNNLSDKGIVLCHGYGESKDTRLISYLANELSKNGFDIFRFDFSSFGESSGDREDFVISHALKDLETSVNYFSDNFGKKEIILLGHSFGSLVCLFFASSWKKQKAVFCLSHVPHIIDMKTKEEYDCKKALKKISSNIFFIHGRADEGIKYDQIFDMLDGSKKTVKIIDGADHFFTGCENIVSNFIFEKIKNLDDSHEKTNSFRNWVRERI